MNVLALIHGDDVRPGIFADVAGRRGDRLQEWSYEWGRPFPSERFDALLVFGGAMHADQEAKHPWLLEELELLQSALASELPTLGVCLGAQLLTRAAGGTVHPASEPEIGWREVELAGVEDPVVGVLPRRFVALQWHHYTYELPPAAVELARSPVCSQAFRVGSAWGVQFHPEVTAADVAAWAASGDVADPAAVVSETAERIGRWNELGDRLCGAFLDYAAGRSGRLAQSCQEPS